MVITSEPMLEEFDQTLERKFRLKLEDFSFLVRLRKRVEIVTPAPLPKRICRDADDDVVLATAVAGKADFIVTGDNDLLVLKKYRAIRILSPRQFLEMLDRKR